MSRSRPNGAAVALLAFVALTATASRPPAIHAETSKLDPRVRIALAQLAAGRPAAALAQQQLPISEDGRTLDVFVRGPVDRARLEALGVRIGTVLPGLVTARVPIAAVAAVAALPEVTSVRGAAVCEPELNLSVPATGASGQRGASPTFAGYAGQGVLVGVVDSGVDYDHADFDDASGNTRIVHLWDQTVPGAPPAGYGYGTEWSSAQINSGTATETDAMAHGTHVLGIAAGDGSQTGGAIPAYTYAGMAPRADIAFVKTSFATTAIVDGVNYLFQKATARGDDAVVNLSLGSHYGPHDGTSDFETALNALAGPGRIIVKSAGNERGQFRHAEVFASGLGTSATMTVTGSMTSAAIRIDGYYEGSENVRVRVTTPNGTTIGPVNRGASNASYPGTATANGTVYVENGAATTSTGDRQVYLEINVSTGSNANGTWTFTFIPVALGAANGEVDLWRFSTSGAITAEFASGNEDQELISEPGNAANLVTVAAYNTKSNWTGCNGVAVGNGVTVGGYASFSSPGPTRDGRQKPDIAAPGQGIGAARSFDQAGSCPSPPGLSPYLNDNSNHLIQQGTSMAAPHVTGAVALLLQKYGSQTPAQIKTYLAGHATTDGNTGAVWNATWGMGKLRIGDLVDPTTTVTQPDGGESVYVGTPVDVTWNASDAVGVTAVDVELSRTGAAGTYSTLATGIANSGTFAWTPTLPATGNAYIRVRARDAENNAAVDVSDAAFSIIDPTAALVALFAAEPDAGGITVRWQLTNPSAYTSVTPERAPDAAGPWTVVSATIAADGDVSVLTDTQVEAGDTYYYRLSATRTDGGVDRIGPIPVVAGEPLGEFALASVAPNPTGGPTRITFVVPRTAPVRVSIVDVSGREVAELLEATLPPGRYDAVWSGERDRGRAEAGLYFVRYRSPAGVAVKRVTLAR